jgi:hypothetical protein
VRPVGPPTQQLKYAMPAVDQRYVIEVDTYKRRRRPKQWLIVEQAEEAYQWTDNGYGELFTTWTTTVSPSLASMVGPGNCSLAVYIVLLVQN